LLTGLGHRTIGAIFGPRDTSTGRGRERGFTDRLRRAGVPLDAALVRRAPFSYEAGHAAMAELLRRRPTAVFCGNDVLAMGAYGAALATGVGIGDELTIVGFDDIAMASWETFGLTTVRCDIGAVATAAVRLLMDRIEHPGRPYRRIKLPVELVLRATHAAPPPSAPPPSAVIMHVGAATRRKSGP